MMMREYKDMLTTDSAIHQMVHTGTTTVAVLCKEGVVVGTDTRVTMGTFIAHKKGKKVFPLDHHLAMTIAGVVADAQKVVEILRVNATLFRLSNNRPMPVASASRLAANILFTNRWLPLILQTIIVGVDSEGSHIFSVDPVGSITEDKNFTATGSGSPIAFGILEDSYRKDMSLKEAVQLTIKAVSAAIARGAATGEQVEIAVVTPEEGYREFSDVEKG